MENMEKSMENMEKSMEHLENHGKYGEISGASGNLYGTYGEIMGKSTKHLWQVEISCENHWTYTGRYVGQSWEMIGK